MLDSTDVFVIGGGPAGLAAAIAARQHGLQVIVADGAEGPIDKACGEGLMPDGVAALKELGISLAPNTSYPFRGIRFVSGDLAVDSQFPEDKSGHGIRRTLLHQLMIQRATSLDIDLRWRTAVTGIAADGVRLGNHKIKARWIIGADGAHSRVLRWAKLNCFRQTNLRFAFRQHFHLAPWTDQMELHWGRHGEIYVTPVSGEQVCVALISRNPKLRLSEVLRFFPGLQRRLAGVKPASSEKGAVTATRSLPHVTRGNVALIGDASGTVDAITGEGLCLAFQQASALAECLVQGGLRRYELQHRNLASRPRLMSHLMLLLNGRPKLQIHTIRAFRQHPQVFQRFLQLHLGARPRFHLALDGLMLGWGLLMA